MPDSPYSILAVSSLCLICYGVSLGFSRSGIISIASQRKFWNLLLLLAILAAGGLGLFLAICVNLKINMPVIDKLLVWHVDFGIGLLLIAVFHFSWHLRYYRSLFSGDTAMIKKPLPVTVLQNPEVPPDTHKRISHKLLPFALGFTTMATQLILLREFLTVFNGNELIIGIVLANWMLLTGLGAMMNRNATRLPDLKAITTGLFILALLPFVILFLLDWSRNIVLPVGGMPGLAYLLTGTFILLAPFCLLSGWLFNVICRYLSRSLFFKGNPVSWVYGWETFGSIASGILCSMILVFLFEPFQNLSVILLVDGFSLFLIRKQFILKNYFVYPAVILVMVTAAFVFSLDKTALQFLFPGQKIVSFNGTPYGKLVVTQSDGQFNFFENNSLLFTTNNTITNEETVHYALLQRPSTGNILLIGGGISGVAGECLKYPLNRLDYLEINPGILRLGKKFDLLPADKRLHAVTGDPRLLIKKMVHGKTVQLSKVSPNQGNLDSLDYDAVLLNLPEPATLQINRYYTLEFFRMLKTLLKKDGIVSLSLFPTVDYMGSDALKVQSTIYQTLKPLFRNVLVIPGERNYFLASDIPLTPKVASLDAKRGIATEYVNEFYLDDASLKERSDEIMKRIAVKAPVNLDFKPVGCYRQFGYWLSYAGNFGFPFIIIPFLFLLLLGAIHSTGTTVALFTAGFASFSLEIILILAFQVLYGYVYLLTGIFITVFMSGLAAGVFVAKRLPGIPKYRTLIYTLLFSTGLLLFSLSLLYLFQHAELADFLLHSIFGLLIAGIAFITGIQFHIASITNAGEVAKMAATNYSADLIGSAAAAVIVNTWLVPVYGLSVALMAVIAMCLLAITIMLIKKQ